MSGFAFNARTVQPAMGFEPWPDGWYMVMITKSNMKPANTSTPQSPAGYLELAIEAGPGPMQGRTNFIRLNLQNPSQQAVEMAHRTLSAICHVIGQYDVQEMPGQDMCVPMLHNRPFQVRCTTQTNKDTGQTNNNFVAFKDANGNDPGKSPAPMAAPQPQVPQQGPQGWPAPGQPQQQMAPAGQPGPWPGTNPPAGWQAPGQQAPQGPQGVPNIPAAAWPQPGQNNAPATAPQGQPYGAPQNVAPAQQQAPTQWTQQPGQQYVAPWKAPGT